MVRYPGPPQLRTPRVAIVYAHSGTKTTVRYVLVRRTKLKRKWDESNDLHTLQDCLIQTLRRASQDMGNGQSRRDAEVAVVCLHWKCVTTSSITERCPLILNQIASPSRRRPLQSRQLQPLRERQDDDERGHLPRSGFVKALMLRDPNHDNGQYSALPGRGNRLKGADRAYWSTNGSNHAELSQISSIHPAASRTA